MIPRSIFEGAAIASKKRTTLRGSDPRSMTGRPRIGHVLRESARCVDTVVADGCIENAVQSESTNIPELRIN